MDIQQYIAQQRQAGATDQQIVQMLMSGGWAQRDAEAAVGASRQPIAPAQPIQAPMPQYQQYSHAPVAARQTSSRRIPLPLLIIVGLLLISSIVIVALAFFNGDAEPSNNEQNVEAVQSEASSDDQSNQQQGNDLGLARRDSERKNTINFLSTELLTFAANNRGILPESGSVAWAEFIKQVSSTDLLIDPSSDKQIEYTVFSPEVGQVQYVRSAQCGVDKIIGAASERQFAIMTKLETGNYYCLDNANND